jgi:sugar O-acyltransferase (sialic acid O-acetyltransferase NeuD family)
VQGWEPFARWLAGEDPAGLGFVISIANPYAHVRVRLHDRLSGVGLIPVSFADPTALIRSSAVLGPGLQVMPGALIHNEARLERQVMVNTRALIEHDCVLEAGAEVGPGAVLTGRVHVGANTWIGAGATVLPRLRIGDNTIIGAGAVVVSDIPAGVIAVGVPAKPLAGRTTPSAAAS